jgi:aspartate kinase
MDPKFFPEARKIDEISYQEMLELAIHGAKVLQSQSVEYAQQHNMEIRVTSSFINGEGTIVSGKISPKPFCAMAITHNLSSIKVVHEKESDIGEMLKTLKEHIVYVVHRKILQNGSHKFVIMVDKKKTEFVMNALSAMHFVSHINREIVKKSFSQISIIGTLASADIGDHLIAELKQCKIDAFIGSSSLFRISFIVASDKLPDAVAVLHKKCGLFK